MEATDNDAIQIDILAGGRTLRTLDLRIKIASRSLSLSPSLQLYAAVLTRAVTRRLNFCFASKNNRKRGGAVYIANIVTVTPRSFPRAGPNESAT